MRIAVPDAVVRTDIPDTAPFLFGKGKARSGQSVRPKLSFAQIAVAAKRRGHVVISVDVGSTCRCESVVSTVVVEERSHQKAAHERREEYCSLPQSRRDRKR